MKAFRPSTEALRRAARAGRPVFFVAPLMLALMLLGACGGGTAPNDESGAPAADTGMPAAESATPAIDPESLERLQALGYVDFSVEKADTSKQGAYVLNAERVQPGYRLVCSGKLCIAELIDIEGRVVRSWSDQPCEKWSNAELLPDGDMIVPGKDDEGRYLLRMSFDGEVVWKRRIAAHHDAELTPAGELAVLLVRDRREPDYDPGSTVIDCEVARLSDTGEPLESLSLFDVIVGNESHELIRLERRERAPRIDLFHCNSLEWIRRPDLARANPLFRGDRVLVSTRYQDRIYLIDWTTRKLVWSWGLGQISGPHDATLLDNGNILLFDNGLERDWSRVIEVDPRTEKIVWQYGGPGDGAFYSDARGGSQRLPNGNTLISNSNVGHAFEVTPDGKTVWEFWNPRFNDEGHRAIIVRMRSYPAEAIEPLLR